MTDEDIRELARAARTGDEGARFRYRSALGRLAAHGDADAARTLLSDLQRDGLARDYPLARETQLGKLEDSDFGAKGRRCKVLSALGRAYARGIAGDRPALRTIPGVYEPRYLTLAQLATYSALELASVPGLGETLLATLDSILARAGLHFEPSDPPATRFEPSSLPSGDGLTPTAPSPTNGALPGP